METQFVTAVCNLSSTGKEPLSNFKCPLCRKTYSNPCLLPCLHSYCQQCIREYQEQHLFTTEEGEKAFRCPDDACQTLTFERGVEFTKNLHLRREVRAAEKVSAIFESDNPLCDQCDEEATAIMFCKSCCEVMCSECTKSHQRLRKTKAHKLLAIKSTQSKELKQAIASHLASSPAPCPDHPEEVLKLYCVACSQAACMVCMAVSHNGHKSSTMEETARDTAKILDKSTKKLESRTPQLRKALDDVANMKQSVGVEGKMVLNKIKNSFDKLKAVIIEREAALTRQCEEIMQSKHARLDLQMESMQKLESQIAYSTQFASSSTKDHSPDEFMTQSEVILNRLQALQSAFAREKLSPCTTEGILCEIETVDLINSAQELGSVVEGCYPPNCILEVNPPGQPISCETNTEKSLRLVTRNYHDEDMQHGGEAVMAEISKGSEAFSVGVADNGDGTYQIDFVIPDEGQYKLIVTIRNQHVRGSPFKIMAEVEACWSVMQVKPADHVIEPFFPVSDTLHDQVQRKKKLKKPRRAEIASAHDLSGLSVSVHVEWTVAVSYIHVYTLSGYVQDVIFLLLAS